MKKSINPIGPQTKRETKKTARVVKRADRKIITPLSPAGTAAAKAAKKKRVMNTAATVAGSVAGFVTKMAVDARLNRGALRIESGQIDDGGSSKNITRKEAWRAGKNKKSTKK
jgi:hypothetical protein